MAVTTSTRPSSRARARASPVARRRRGASVAARDASSSVPPPSPPPMEIAAAADASEASRTSSSSASADADARPNAETLVDAFESLPKEERVRLVERYVFGVGSEIVAPDVKMDVDVDGVAAIGRAELTEEELADLRDFGPPPKAGSGGADAFQSEDALVDKWREVFGEDPPENGGGGVEDILGPEPEGIGSIVGGVKSAVSLKLYGVERAWDKLAYRFGRVGAIVASGLASVGIAVVVNSLIPKSQGAKDDVDLINRVSSVGRKDAEQTADAKDTIPEMEASKAPSSTNGVLWERKTSVKEHVPDPTPSSTNGVLWTRKGDKEGRKSARQRMGPAASGTFDDRDRGDEPAPQVLWTRKNDPELSEMTVESPKARPRRRMRVAGSPLDDNLEDLRAFRRQDSERDSPR